MRGDGGSVLEATSTVLSRENYGRNFEILYYFEGVPSPYAFLIRGLPFVIWGRGGGNRDKNN